MKLRDKVMELVLLRLNGKGYFDLDYPLILSFIEEAEYKIKNFCQLSNVPEELKFVWSNIVIDFTIYTETIKDVKSKAIEGQDSVDVKPIMGNIRFIKQGDTTIESFDREDVEDYQKAYLNARKLNLDDFIYNYKADLYEFRTLGLTRKTYR